MQRMKVAFVGTSGIGEEQLRGWLKNTDIAQVVAIQSRSMDRAKEFALRYGIPHVYTDYDAMLDEQKPDLVDLANLPEYHVPMTIAAAHRGIHVICQKPVALTWEDSVRMVKVCEDHGVKLMANEIFRRLPWFGEVRNLVRAGRIGAVVRASLLQQDAGPMKWTEEGIPKPWTMRGYNTTRKHFVLDTLIHRVDILRSFFGDAKTVYAHLARQSTAVDGEDNAMMIVGFDAVSALVDHSWPTFGPSWSLFRIDGTQGVIELDDDRRIRLYDSQSDEPAYVSDQWATGEHHWVYYPDVFAEVQRDFVRWIAGGPEPETSGRRNLETMRMCFAACESSETGEVISLEHWGEEAAH